MMLGAMKPNTPRNKIEADIISEEIEALKLRRHELDPSYPDPRITPEERKRFEEEYNRSVIGRITRKLIFMWGCLVWGLCFLFIWYLFTR